MNSLRLLEMMKKLISQYNEVLALPVGLCLGGCLREKNGKVSLWETGGPVQGFPIFTIFERQDSSSQSGEMEISG